MRVCVRGGLGDGNNVSFSGDWGIVPFHRFCLYTALVSLPASLSAHPCLSVIPYTSPQLYTFTLYPSAEHSSPALIQLGFIKPDHWRIRVVLVSGHEPQCVCVCVCPSVWVCEEDRISVCIYVRIEKIIHVDTVGMCAWVCVFGSWQLITAQQVIGQTGRPKEPWEQSWGAGNEQWPQ